MGKNRRRKNKNNSETNTKLSKRKLCTTEIFGNTEGTKTQKSVTSTDTDTKSSLFSSIFGANSNANDSNMTAGGGGGGVLDLFSSSQAHKLQKVSSERIVQNQNNLKNADVGGDRKDNKVGSKVLVPSIRSMPGHSDRQKTIDCRRNRNAQEESILTINSISVCLPIIDDKADNEEDKTHGEADDLQKGIMRLFTNQADAVMRDKGVLILHSPEKHSSVRLFDESLLNSLSAKAKQIENDVCKRLGEEGKIWQAKDQGEAARQKNDQIEKKSAFQYHEVASRCLGRLDIRYAMDQPPFSYVDVVNNPYLMPIIKSLLGQSAKLVYAGLILSFPNSRDQPWHQDGEALFDEHDGFSSEMHLPPYALNVFIPLDDISEELGPTEFCVGSHFGSIAKEIMQPKSTKFEHSSVGPLLNCGDVLIYDYRICHRGTSNLSIDRTRPMLYLMYARPWFCEHLNFGQDRLF
mmetsp:Transcript_3375/g.4912  ORF Transcript_3375/g.4912 Transcript_3375/m.4912 type:complete len:463 (-) Transcript_3375:19-1407(-)